MATEGLPPDRVPQELRRQTLSQLEEAIRNYPGTPGATPPSLQNPTDVENNLFDQSRNSDDYTAKLQRILFMLTKRKSLQNLAAQNPQQQQQQSNQSLSQSSNLQQQQQSQLSGAVSYSVSGSNMAGVNSSGMGMTRPMQQMQQPGGGGGYQTYQGGGTAQQMHPAQHPHYSPHMHRAVGGSMQHGMQPGMHPAQRPMMAGVAQGMVHGGPYGHAQHPMSVHNYPQNVNYQPHFNPGMSVANQMHGMGMPQRQPSINPSLMRPQQGPMGRGMPGMGGGGMIQQHSGPGAMGMGRGGMGKGGGVPAGMGRVGGVYGGPMVQQVQTGFPSDISGSVQPVMAVPNPSYLPASSVGGLRQPAPPYDSVGPPASSSAVSNPSAATSLSNAPSLPPSSSAPPSSSSSQPQSSHPHPPPSTSSSTTAINYLQSQPVPSPAPPTPLLPASPATSIESPAHSTVTPEENEAYLRTHHELQVYLPLLTRMMNRTLKKEGEDAHKSEQYMKLKSLHSLLQDDKKRVPLPTLIKCKTALEKMFEQQQLREHLDSTSSQPPPSNPPSVAPAPPATSSAANPTLVDPPIPSSMKPLPEPKSQSLLEFKMIPSPTPTLGNLMETCTVRSHPFPADRLPPSKRMCNRVEPTISPCLRREIAHLVGFKVHPLPQKEQTRGTMLECTIVDEDLPKVPSLTVRIPPGYPDYSPECDLESYGGGDPTPLLSEVGKLLADTLACCCDSYTLSFLLSSWETSLLKALSSQF